MHVIVVDYDPHWPKKFELEASHLQTILMGTLVKVHHIGSTSVPGLMAKPIIDLMLEVSDLVSLDTKNASMQDLGYEVMGAYGILGRRYYRKGGDHRTHQIHAFATGDPNIRRHLAFRDYLKAHQPIAQEYGQLKWDLAQRCNHDIEKYCDGKDPFIKLHETKALAWYASKANPNS